MMQPVFDDEDKRRIAMELIATGRWKAADWPALAAVVRSRLLGLDSNGRVVEAPNARALLAVELAAAGSRSRRRRTRRP